METDKAAEWSDEEIDATVQAYFKMLELEQRGERYQKAIFNEELRRGALARRTKASVEYRMQNISAVLEDLGMPRIQGYRPAQNVGARVRSRIEQIIKGDRAITPQDLEPTANQEHLPQ